MTMDKNVKCETEDVRRTVEQTELALGEMEQALDAGRPFDTASPAQDDREDTVGGARFQANGLPEGWMIPKMGGLAKVITKGTTPTTAGYKYTDSGIPFIKVENIGKNGIELSSVHQFISDEAHESLKRSQFEVNDVLFSIAGTIGKTALVSEADLPANTNQAVAIIRGVSDFFEPKFLRLQLTEASSRIAKEKARGGGMNNVSLGDLKSLDVLLPPLAEQTVIAQTLDTLLAQVDNIKTRLDAIPNILKTFRQSVLAAAVSGKLTEAWRGENECGDITPDIEEILEERSKLVSKRTKTPVKHLESDEYAIPKVWKWVSLDSLASKIVDGVHHKPEYVEEGIPFMSVKDINHGKMSFDYCKFISEETHEEIHPRCNPEKGDLLITKSGTIGRTAIVDTDKIFDLFVSVALIKPASAKVNMKYIDIALCQWVNSIDVSSRVVGTAIKNLHLRDMRVLAIPFAPLQEQTEIVRRVEELFAFADQIEQQVQTAQGRVNNLTQSILAKAFRGELTAQWRADNPDLISGDNSAEALLAKIQQEREKLKPKKATKKKTTRKKTAKKAVDK